MIDKFEINVSNLDNNINNDISFDINTNLFNKNLLNSSSVNSNTRIDNIKYNLTQKNVAYECNDDYYINDSFKYFNYDFKSNKDDNNNKPYLFVGDKGHFNYISKEFIEMSSKKQAFELKIENCSKFNYNEYFKDKKKTGHYSSEYFDNLIKNGNYFPNVRFGIMHEYSDKRITVGTEFITYSYRTLDGALLNNGNLNLYNTYLREDDILGMVIVLRPPKPEFLKNKNSLSNENKSKFSHVEKQNNNNNMLNKYSNCNLDNRFTTILNNKKTNKDNSEIYNNMTINEESYIEFYVNGDKQEYMFKGLYEGNYRLVVSLYNMSYVSLNCNSNNLKYKYY